MRNNYIPASASADAFFPWVNAFKASFINFFCMAGGNWENSSATTPDDDFLEVLFLFLDEPTWVDDSSASEHNGDVLGAFDFPAALDFATGCFSGFAVVARVWFSNINVFLLNQKILTLRAGVIVIRENEKVVQLIYAIDWSKFINNTRMIDIWHGQCVTKWVHSGRQIYNCTSIKWYWIDIQLKYRHNAELKITKRR